MTIAMLMQNTLEAYQFREGILRTTTARRAAADAAAALVRCAAGVDRHPRHARGAVGLVFQHHALLRQFIAQPVGFLEIPRLARGKARRDALARWPHRPRPWRPVPPHRAAAPATGTTARRRAGRRPAPPPARGTPRPAQPRGRVQAAPFDLASFISRASFCSTASALGVLKSSSMAARNSARQRIGIGRQLRPPARRAARCRVRPAWHRPAAGSRACS